jgi:hypothetical protein
MTDYTPASDPAASEPSSVQPPQELLHANMSALASVQTTALSSAQSALGSVSVEGDASIRTSAVGVMNAGTASVHQSLIGAVLTDGDATVSQSLTPLVAARKATLDNAASCMMVTGEASATRSWIGLMAARNATLSDDSRVIIDWKAALIIGVVLLGGFGLLAAAVFVAARRVAGAVSTAASNLPHLPHMPQLPDLPHLPEWAEKLARLRHAG